MYAYLNFSFLKQNKVLKTKRTSEVLLEQGSSTNGLVLWVGFKLTLRILAQLCSLLSTVQQLKDFHLTTKDLWPLFQAQANKDYRKGCNLSTTEKVNLPSYYQ